MEIRESRRAAAANEGETTEIERTTATIDGVIHAPHHPVDDPTTPNEIATKNPVLGTTTNDLAPVPALHDVTPTPALLHQHLAMHFVTHPATHPATHQLQIGSHSFPTLTPPQDNPQVPPATLHHPLIRSDRPPQRQSPAR